MYVIGQSTKFPIFQINDHIGFDSDVLDENGNITEAGDGQGIDGKIFSKEFFETDIFNPELITLYVNTMGGDVQDSLSMFNAIARAKAKTKGVISGFAYSCGGWLPLACDIVHMTEQGSWMCHMPYTPGKDKQSDFIEAVLNIIANIISSKSGRNGKPKKTVDQIKEMMQKKTYLTPTQMYDEGLIDDITDASGKKIKVQKKESFVYNIETDSKQIKLQYMERQAVLNKEFSDIERKELAKTGAAEKDGSFPIESSEDLKHAISDWGRAGAKESDKNHIKKRAKELGIESLLPDNWKINNNEKISNMKKVINRLRSVNAMKFNLVEDSSEEDIVSSIATMENKINNLMTEKEGLDTQCANYVGEIKVANESKAEMQKRMEELQSAKNSMDSEISNLKTKMENMEAENALLKTEKEKADNLIKEADKFTKTAKAEKLIDNFVKTGRITAANKEEFEKIRTGWIEDAVENYDKTERQLMAIPVKMSMPNPVFPDSNDSGIDAGKGSISEFQAINRAEREERRRAFELHNK